MKYVIEIVAVAPDAKAGRPERRFVEAGDIVGARDTARRQIREMVKSGNNTEHVVRNRPEFLALAYTDAAGIVGYANIAREDA